MAFGKLHEKPLIPDTGHMHNIVEKIRKYVGRDWWAHQIRMSSFENKTVFRFDPELTTVEETAFDALFTDLDNTATPEIRTVNQTLRIKDIYEAIDEFEVAEGFAIILWFKTSPSAPASERADHIYLQKADGTIPTNQEKKAMEDWYKSLIIGWF